MADTVVKIDAALLAEVEAFIREEENRFKYVNRKQFIDLAVIDYLRKQKKRMRGRGTKKK